MENEKNKKKFKIMFICMSIVLCCFLMVGIVQTFVLKSKQANLSNLQQSNSKLEQEYNQTKDEYEYKGEVDEDGNVTVSDDYYNDYWENNGDVPYGEDGDKVIEIN